MIELTDEFFLGKGTARFCYVDPRDSTRCIKVDFGNRSFSQTTQEAKYYRRLAKIKPDFTYDCIPRFHGFVETNRGIGGIFDIVQDEATGKTSNTLRYYLQNGTIARDRPIWEKALQDFRDSVLGNGIVVGDLKPGNLCARIALDGTVRLVVIDGIGHRDLLPLCDYFPALARRRVRGNIRRFGLDSVQSLLDKEERKNRAKSLAAARQ